MNLKRFLSTFLFFFILIIIILFTYDSINSINDISRLNKMEIYDKDNNKIYEITNYHESSYISLSEINDLTISSFICIEDKNFYNHSGFDIYRITKVFFKNIINKQKVGASTITQQYVKNLYLSNKKSYIRKAKELNYAIRLERIYTKDEILEGYLNTIYFGHNIYGIKDASMFFFNKNPIDLNANEIALLIAIIKSPSNYSPINNFSDSMNRKDTILSILKKNRVINNDLYDHYYKQNLVITKSKINNYSSALLYYKDQVIKEYNSLNIKSKFTSVYQIYTNYDQQVNDDITNYVNSNDTGCDIGVSIVDSQGFYVSCIGGINYSKSTYNVCSDGIRDIGSTIKPLLYYNALQHGFSALSTFTSEKSTFYLNNEAYTFSNYHDIYENKKITLGYALATSDNIFAVKTHLYLGMNGLVSRLKDFGITAKEIPSLALGSVSMSLNKLTNIYSTFSNLGNYIDNSFIKEIRINNKIYYSKNKKRKSLLDSSNTFILNNIMTNTFDTNLNNVMSVTASSISKDINHSVAGKSGLTDFDSYMLGFNPLYTIGVWCGFLDNRELVIRTQQAMPKQIFKVAFNSLMNEKEDIWYKCPNNVRQEFTDPTLFNTGYKKLVYFKN